MAKERKIRFLSREEVKKLRAMPDTTTLLGARDRAIAEVLLGTGMKISELEQLNRGDIYSTTGTIQVRGGSRRHIPISESAQEAVRDYLQLLEDGLEFNRRKDKEALFLDREGRRLSAETIRDLLLKTFRAAGIPLMGGRNVLRNTFAMEQVRKGINLKRLEVLLGLGRSTAKAYRVLARQEAVEK